MKIKMENQNDFDQAILNLNKNLSSNLDLQNDYANDNHDNTITSRKSIVPQDNNTGNLAR